MPRFEYRIVPAPLQGEKARGAKTAEDRFAIALASAINGQAREGWEYVRCDTLPTEERAGLTKRRIVYVNLLVFRRETDATESSASPSPLIAEKPAGGLRGLTRRFTSPPITAGSRPAAAGPKIAAPAEGPAPKLGPATGSSGEKD